MSATGKITDKIIATTPAHKAAIETLLAQGFGPGRHARTAERLREQSTAYTDLSYVLSDDTAEGTQILASISYSPIRVGGDAGLLLGPLIVSPILQNRGIGVELMTYSLAFADKLTQFQFVLLVGDLPYYQRVGFGSTSSAVIMPGPVDAARLLVRGKTDIAGKVCGAPDLA
ncbi:MAG: N-acetyltransferase [Alphaproteobacteria bacterium]|nr:N-acetyltransferase [Alphaproteobacteria bacterium]MBE8219778.1 N-acetyltransferase [Alphaproteobacteria bacterium]